MPNYVVGAPKLSKSVKALEAAANVNIHDAEGLRAAIDKIRKDMKKASEKLEFEHAAELRDQARALEQIELTLR